MLLVGRVTGYVVVVVVTFRALTELRRAQTVVRAEGGARMLLLLLLFVEKQIVDIIELRKREKIN